MPEQLLDRPEVGAAFEHVRGEGVAQRVGRDAARDRRLAHPALQAPAKVGGMQPAPALGDEQRRLVAVAHERMTAALEVGAERPLGRLADRDQARLAALSLDAEALAVEVHRPGVEVDHLLRAQAAGVGQLQHRPVAKLERRAGRYPVEKGRSLVAAQDPRQPGVALRARDQVGRVRDDVAVAEQCLVEAPDRRKLPRDRRLRGALLGERGGEVAKVLVPQAGGLPPPLVGPGRELAEVGRVRAARALGDGACAQLAIEGREGAAPCAPELGVART